MLLVALAAALALVVMLPVRLRVQYLQDGWRVRLHLEAGALLMRLRRSIDASGIAARSLEHALKRWIATGEPVKVPLQKTARRLPRIAVLRVVGRPARYLAPRVRCTRLYVRAELGGYDAMESALLAGASWTAVANGIAVLRRWVRVEPGVPVVSIQPQYAGPALRIHADCILRFRVGHAIVAGVWLLRRALRERELMAWAWESWRRKGVDGSGRTSDSGPDEDGHGESQGDGGRQHGDR